MDNPYSGLPSRAYWRTGVAGKNHLEVSDLYRKKFSIRPADAVATAGSCFAQHIGRQMVERGFAFKDFEPAPSYMQDDAARSYGYKMYSARFGNIYTVRQLKQLFLRAFGEFVPDEQYWENDGRYYDPFRPSIEPGGYETVDELLAVQSGHLEAVKEMFTSADVFVFTLGLTEGWIANRDGSVFPTCPGTVAGTFDAEKYRFHSFTYPEILEDFTYVIERTRRINPDIKFLLTVSPVPLTATASGEHILSANSYSKSVLRAVAGDLYNAYDFIDYFPSYEIIAAASSRAMFYEPNMRSVTMHGVGHVMSYFFAEHQLARAESSKARSRILKSEAEVICDEERLDASAAQVAGK